MERETQRQLHTSLLDEECSSTYGIQNGGSSVTAAVVLSTFIAVCGSYVFGASVGYSSPAENGIRSDLGLSVAEYSIFGSILTIGAMLGAAMSGKIADVVGQRIAMGISEILCIIGWLAIFLSKNAWPLDLGRLLTGIGVGSLSYLVPVYIADVTPKNLRGGFANFHQFMITFGTAMTYILGTVVSWRILALIGTIPCLVHLVGLFMIPESPRWLAKTGRHREFEVTLQNLRGANSDISQEANQIKDYTELLEQLPKARILELFQRTYSWSLIVGVGLMLLRQLGGVSAISFYASSIFEAAGFSATIGTIVMAAVQIVMIILSVFLTDKSGRRVLLMVSASGTCVGCLLVGLAFSLQDIHWCKAFAPIVAFVGILVYSAFFGVGLAAIPWLLMSEIFPVNVKGSAGSLVSMVNWFTSWIVTFVFNFSMEWSSAGTFYIFAGIGGLTVIFVAKMVPETKRRTLEEIQAAMNPLAERR
ncbi:hypothetical protein SLE2022_082980 [Rubroshorea leprosula]